MKLIRNIEKHKGKLSNIKTSLVFNEIYMKENLLPTYTNIIFLYTSYLYLYIQISLTLPFYCLVISVTQ